MHYPELVERMHTEAHAGRRQTPYGGVSEIVPGSGPRQGPNDPDFT
jgi:cytochrome c oxidase subunit 1